MLLTHATFKVLNMLLVTIIFDHCVICSVHFYMVHAHFTVLHMKIKKLNEQVKNSGPILRHVALKLVFLRKF